MPDLTRSKSNNKYLIFSMLGGKTSRKDSLFFVQKKYRKKVSGSRTALEYPYWRCISVVFPIGTSSTDCR